MAAKVSVTWHVDNHYYKLPLIWHLRMLLVDIPTVSFIDIMHAYVNQLPYYHFVILEWSALDLWGRGRLSWRDRSEMVRSLFCHEKLSHEPICLKNILSIIPTLWGQVAIWETDCHVGNSHNICDKFGVDNNICIGEIYNVS